MKQKFREHARQRIDERLSVLRPEDRFAPPPKGWIRAIREALGMTGVQLAARLEVRPQTVDALEKSEASGSIQLSSLRRAAEALDCTLVYVLVPRKPLEEIVSERARRIARRELGRIAHTMKLEDQEAGDPSAEKRIDSYIRSVLKDRDLWNEK
jgi:predicted DNA-binding mobile mystery protein A